VAGAVLNGVNMRHILSTGLAATPENCNGVPFNASHVYASGNIAGRHVRQRGGGGDRPRAGDAALQHDRRPGMKDMLAFLIARDTMHQQQWLAVIEELGGHEKQLPIPNSFPQGEEKTSSPTPTSCTTRRRRSRRAAGRRASRSTARASTSP
jgi:Mn-containing catalase